jgi:hypothetical protein
MMATNTSAAVREIVETTTEDFARIVADACGGPNGNPASIAVGFDAVTVRYDAPVPCRVAGDVRDGIVDDLAREGFPYDELVRITPTV